MLGPWKPYDSEYVLPNDAPASLFQYRFAVAITFDVDVLGAQSGLFGGLVPDLQIKDFDLNFTVQMLSGETVIFEQEVILKYEVITAVFFAFGAASISSFVWFIRSEDINTTIVNGEAITEENPAWKYTLGNTPFSEFGTSESGGGSDYTDMEGHINDWWDSPAYKMSVPVGAVWNIVTSQVEGGTLPQNLQFQFRFNESASTAGFWDHFGVQHTAMPAGGGIELRVTTREDRKDRTRAILVSGDSPSYAKTESGRLMLWYSDKNVRRMAYSDDNALSIQETPAVIQWPGTGWTAFTEALDKSGNTAAAAVLEGTIYFQFVRRWGTPSTIRPVGDYDGKPIRLLLRSTATQQGVIQIRDDGDVNFVSRDGGLKWEAEVAV